MVEIEGKVGALRRCLAEMERVVVAFSGGADSSFVAFMARSVLGKESATCVTAVSPSMPPGELEDCRQLAAEWDLEWGTVETTELDDPAYVSNGIDRCRHCKTALMGALAPLADPLSATVVLGVNLDDLGDHRPGQEAAASAGARFPLVEAGFSKPEVRSASRHLGLRTWDKPAAACLASRIPYGTPVSAPVLGRVGRAESALRGLGFRQVRVRHYGDSARIELEDADLPRAVAEREAVVAAVQTAGYRYVTLDLEGYRSGNLNRGHLP